MQSQDPEGNVVEKVYDKVGRLLRVNNGSDTVSYTYYDNGNMERVTYPDNAYTAYTYYSNNDLKTVQNVNSSGTTIEAYNYAYDGNRNQTTVLDGYGTTRYEYNALNQLAKETLYNGQITQYTYDGAGNRSTESVVASAASEPDVTTYSYDGRNLLTATVEEKTNGSEVHTEFYYDNNGNLYSKLKSELAPVSEATEASVGLLDSSTEMTLYEYDVWNNLVKSIQGEAVVENTYNGLGQRVQKASSTAEENKTTKYLYDGAQVALEVDADTEEATLNIHGHALVGRKTGDERFNYLYNGHGDVTKIIGSNSAIMGSYYYDAFGNLLEDESAVDNSYKYAGYQHDEENGLYYLNARLYDPEIARFIQEDTYRGNTADPLSLNLYTYCVNNPVKYYDPTGHKYYYVGDSTKVEAKYDQTYFWKGYAYDYIPEDMPLCYVTPEFCVEPTHRHITISFTMDVGQTLKVNLGEIIKTENQTEEDIKKANAIWLVNSDNTEVLVEPSVKFIKSPDKELSDGALIYILKYYDPQYREQANAEILKVRKPEDENYVAAIKELENIRKNVEDIKKLDSEGKVSGKLLDVPVYNQLDVEVKEDENNLCWATCAAMWIMYLFKDPYSADYDIGRYYEYERKGIWQMIEDIAVNVAKKKVEYGYEKKNADGTYNFNLSRPWQSTDKVGIAGITASQVQSDGEAMLGDIILYDTGIETVIKAGSPFAVLYGSYEKDAQGKRLKDEHEEYKWMDGHWVLGIGYAKVIGNTEHDFLVISNDPGKGVQRIQIYEEFIGPNFGRDGWYKTAAELKYLEGQKEIVYHEE